LIGKKEKNQQQIILELKQLINMVIAGTTFEIKPNSEKILLAGPWIGEFGWELCCWQGFIRRLSKEFKKTIVVSKAGHEFLYRDFCDEYHIINLPPNNLQFDGWSCAGINEEYLLSQINGINYDFRQPAVNIGFEMNGSGYLSLFDDRFLGQHYIKYKSDLPCEKVDILVHPRNREVGNHRNWDLNSWQSLIQLLSEKYIVGIIGTTETFELKGVKDFRNIPIENTVALMNNCKLVVGQSSGPLHLASLCGTPHLVWSEEYNRNRYTKYWNPHNTPVYFYSEMGWNPKVNFIYNKIVEILK
jgi:hypothetical protein